MGLKFGAKGCFVFIISMLFLTDLAILLNIPFLRQILGFFFLTLLPGLLILRLLKLNKIESTEKIVLAVGLSISFLMFFGLLINNLSLSLGYLTPLSTISLLVSLNIALIALAIMGYKVNKDATFSLPNLSLSISEKTFLIVPILFPALSIFGMYVMNMTNNNIILMLLLFLIPIYVAFVCVFNHKFSKRLYPVVIFLISISLLLLLSLRSNHLIGADVHREYYFFRTMLGNSHWSILGYGVLDACLCISLLPTIYQSMLNINPEFLYKILYSLIYSVSPLVIYIISKKYVGEGYAFLASCFFMFQANFLLTASNARTNTAILFFALAMMTLFSDRIDPLKKRILFIVFMASCIVSHYATAYIFFFVMLGTFIGLEMLSKKYSFKKVVSLTLTILFFSMIFFWYSQVTETAFNAGVGFVEETLSNLNMFFVEESRQTGIQAMLGEGILEKGIPHKIEFVFTWLTFAFIGIGIITLIRKYKEMSFLELNFKKPEFLKDKFEVSYFMIALTCSGLLVATVVLPYISKYSLTRLYSVAITILSVFFMIGGITLSKHFFFFAKHFLSKERTCAKKECNSFGKDFLSKKRFVLKEKQKSSKNMSQVRAYLIILLVLIPYFLCVSGVMYNMFGVPRSIILNSEGISYCAGYVHDQECYAPKWLKDHTDKKDVIYADWYGADKLISYAETHSSTYAKSLIEDKVDIKIGYIYLTYCNVIGGKLLDQQGQCHNLTEYSHLFVGKSNIYGNGGSEIYIQH